MVISVNVSIGNNHMKTQQYSDDINDAAFYLLYFARFLRISEQPMQHLNEKVESVVCNLVSKYHSDFASVTYDISDVQECFQVDQIDSIILAKRDNLLH